MRTIVILIIFLINPWYQVYRDRKGDVHPNNDWMVALFSSIVLGCLVAVSIHEVNFTYMLRYSLSAGLLCASVFPYWVNYVELKNGITRYQRAPKFYIYSFKSLTIKEILDHVVNHLSNTAWPDKTKLWRSIGWGGRLIVCLILFITSILLVAL